MVLVDLHILNMQGKRWEELPMQIAIDSDDHAGLIIDECFDVWLQAVSILCVQVQRQSNGEDQPEKSRNESNNKLHGTLR
jgi:hypothetical protein